MKSSRFQKSRIGSRIFSLWLLATLALSLPFFAVIAGDQRLGEDEYSLSGPWKAHVDERYASPKVARSQLKGYRSFGTPISTGLDPAIYGEWTTLGYTTTVRGIHVTLLHTGKVLLAAGSGNFAPDFHAGSFTAELWDPTDNSLVEVPPPWDMFCAGHVVEPDGNVLVMGGTINYPDGGFWGGSNKTYRFNVATSTWEQKASMQKGRWYPTAILDPTGTKVLVYSGRDEIGANTKINEVYDRLADTWSLLPTKNFPLYPGMLWTAKDQIFFSGAATGGGNRQVGLYSPFTGKYTAVTGGIDMTLRGAAATVFAGAVQNQLAWLAGGGFPAVSSTVLTDLTQTQPVSVVGPALPTAKAYVSAVNLPDLTVLETGGGTARNSPVYEASIFNPSDRSIRPVAPPTVGRTYHSSAILLPDGSVATFGGDPGGLNKDKSKKFELRIEIYKPDYFFKGPRPTISAAPVEVTYGGVYAIQASATDASLSIAVLERPASTTHSTDPSQRTILLGFAPTADGGSITMPSAQNIAPPGWYMLFVTDSLGRPSTAKWIHLQ
jgi:Domain of unknown function (DUF1929)